jgi:hypothetical protein
MGMKELSSASFRNIPIDGKVEDFMDQLSNLDYYVSDWEGLRKYFSGTWVGFQIHGVVYYSIVTHTVYRIEIYFEQVSEAESLKDMYFRLRDLFAKKWGWYSVDYTNNSDSECCHYEYMVEDTGEVVTWYFGIDDTDVVLSYTSEENKKIAEKEQNEALLAEL